MWVEFVITVANGLALFFAGYLYGIGYNERQKLSARVRSRIAKVRPINTVARLFGTYIDYPTWKHVAQDDTNRTTWWETVFHGCHLSVFPSITKDGMFSALCEAEFIDRYPTRQKAQTGAEGYVLKHKLVTHV